MSTYFELSRRDTKIHCYNKTGYQPCGTHSRFFTKSDMSLVKPAPFCPSFPRTNPTPPPQSDTKTHTRTDLVPEFDLSVPAAGDDLGGFMWMPQGADAHLVMSLDPVVQLGGLPVPDVQLSVGVS